MASSKYSQRPRAPSPPGPSPIRQGATPHHRDNFAFLRQQHSGGGAGHESDTHAYSTVDGPPPPARMSQRPSVPPPAVPPKNRIDRMFGDSHGEESSNEASGGHPHNLQQLLNRSLTGSSNRNGSVSSNASSSTVSSKRGGSLAQIYQTRKNISGSSGTIIADANTVHQIKNQFQAQIESMLQSQVRNQQQPLRSGHIQSTSERELNMIRGLQRDKSFDEARTAVQKQIERIFSSTQNEADATAVGAKPSSTSLTNLSQNTNGLAGNQALDRQIQLNRNLLQNPHSGLQLGAANKNAAGIKHGMHGVSHALPGELDEKIRPPPIHYGVNQAIQNRQSQLLRTKNFLSNNDLNSGSPPAQSPQSSISQGQPMRRSHDSLLDSPPLRPNLEQVSSRLDPPASFSNNNTSSPNLSNPPVLSDPQRRPNITNSGSDLGNIDITASRRLAPSAVSTPKTPSSGSSRRQTTFAPSPTISSKSGGNTSESSIQRQKQPPFRKEFVRHKVDYLGSLPISSKSTNLASLQRPLKDLYFKYRAMRNLGQTNLPGTLEINDTGLTVQYIRELHKGVQEIFNPFPTIAVWAAVKFIHKRELVDKARGVVQHRFAFLPLISDPEANDKMRLFHDLESEHEVELAADAPHPPVFACVMRRMTNRGSARASMRQQLECHGFVCATSEDAILIAANLYQALLETMKKQKASPKAQSEAPVKRLAPSRPSTQSPSITSARGTDSDTSHMPKRPPRRKRRGGMSVTSGSEYSGPASVPASVLQRRKSVRSSVRSNRSSRSNRSAVSRTKHPVSTMPGGMPSQPSRPVSRAGTSLSRNDSRRSSRRSTAAAVARAKVASSRGFAPQTPKQSGDVYTRVAMPRSKSFMNVNNQYNLQELFKELKEKEGVESIDDVLKKIISPNGISFNEIKPVYRELLLKLAMTMSQDEIFQRSKNILQQQQKESKNDKKKDGGNFKKNSKTMTMEKSASKKKAKAAKKAASGKDAYMSQSTLGGSKNREQSTLGSFFKWGASSKSKENLNQQSYVPTGKHGSKATYNIDKPPMSPSGKKPFNKSDISGPIPIAGSGPKPKNLKTPLIQRSSKITSTPLPPPPVQSNPSRDKAKAEQAKSKSSSSSPTEESSVDDAYGSCSECAGVYDYSSVSQCTYDSCSCRGSTKAKDSKVKPKQFKEIEKHFREHGGGGAVSSAKIPEEAHSHKDHPDDCDCETDSCIYSEKCYCSLRGDPRGSTVVPARSARGTIIPPPPALPSSPPSNAGSSSCSHCDSGSEGTHTQKSLTHQRATARSIASTEITTDDSGTDTTCYSVRHIPVTVHRTHDGTSVSGDRPRTSMEKGRNASLNGMQSPATAWKRSQQQQLCDDSDCNYSDVVGEGRNVNGGTVRSVTSLSSSSASNCRQCQANHAANHHRHDEIDDASKSGGGSGGSGYHSNDSYSNPQNYSSGHHQVMYKGSTNHRHKSGGGINSHHNQSPDPSSMRASSSHHGRSSEMSTPSGVKEDNNVLHMKKSAEIAAVFSGAKINQTTDLVDPFSAATTPEQQIRQPYSHMSGGSHHRENFSEADMHSSLGYFP